MSEIKRRRLCAYDDGCELFFSVLCVCLWLVVPCAARLRGVCNILNNNNNKKHRPSGVRPAVPESVKRYTEPNTKKRTTTRVPSSTPSAVRWTHTAPYAHASADLIIVVNYPENGHSERAPQLARQHPVRPSQRRRIIIISVALRRKTRQKKTKIYEK